jgi:cobalt-zinc-cadmium efflux system outer membrane protein
LHVFGIPLHPSIVRFPIALAVIGARAARLRAALNREARTMWRFSRVARASLAVRGIAVALPTALVPQLSAAQALVREPLTLTAAVERARTQHPALASASARRKVATSLARQDAAFTNPVVEWRRENLGAPLTPDIFATVSQPLDLTGRRIALRARAREVDRSASADSMTTLRDVESAAARAFWRASLASALFALAEQQRIDADRLARFEEVRAAEGAVAEVVAIRTRVEHERARIAEVSARANLISAMADLARAIGTSPDSLPPVAPLPTTAALVETLPSVDVAVDYALSHRSELAALAATVNAANQRLSAERRAVLSDVAVELGAKQTAGYSTRVVAVAVPVPLLNRNTAARERAAAELDLVKTDRRTMEQMVRTSVITALESCAALLAARPAGVDSLVARAAEVVRIADAAYAAGGGSLLELLDARRAHLDALTAALRWTADVHLARLELLRSMGASPLDSLEHP